MPDYDLIADLAKETTLQDVASRLQGTLTITLNGEPVALDAATLATLQPLAVQPVSGTVSVQQDGSWTVALDAASLAALETVTVQQGTSPWVVSGTVSVTGAVDTGLTQPTTPADTQPVSAASLPLPAGAATEATLASLDNKSPDLAGTWGYHSGTSGTLNMSGGKRVLQITAVALESAGSLTINGGDTITLPYGSTDKVSSEITIVPRGNLTDPTITFTGTSAFFVEFVT